MKINIKTQSSRATKMLYNFNCVNLFFENFEVGLETRRWGEKKESQHRITFEINGEDYVIPLDKFKQEIIPILNKLKVKE